MKTEDVQIEVDWLTLIIPVSEGFNCGKCAQPMDVGERVLFCVRHRDVAFDRTSLSMQLVHDTCPDPDKYQGGQ